MKMVVAWHDAAFTLPDAVLTPEVMRRVLDKFHLQHKLKATWTASEANLYGKLTTLEEGGAGSQEVQKKDQGMLDQQNQLLEEIGRERTGLGDMRSEQKSTTTSENDESDKDKRAKEREEDLKKFL